MARLEHLDGLRAVLALWVVGNHAWLTIYPTVGAMDNPHGLLGLVTTWMVYGHFAVVAFIVVSGYSLAISTSANEARLPGGFLVFLRRRFTRIVLPYWGALFLSLVVAVTIIGTDTGTHWDAALPVTSGGVLLHVFLLQDFALTGQINHALWSIALEWHIYFLFPLILLLRRRFGLLHATVGVILVGLLVSAVHDGGLTLWDEANFIGCFALGVAARELSLRASPVQWDVLAAVLLGGFAALSGSLGTLRAAEQSNTLLEPAFALGVAALLVALSQERSAWLRRGLSWRPLAAVGAYSYSLYLLHAPVLQLVWQYVMRPLGLPLHDGWALGWLLLLGLPASLLVGWAYFRVVERPCMSLGRPGSAAAGGLGEAQRQRRAGGRGPAGVGDEMPWQLVRVDGGVAPLVELDPLRQQLGTEPVGRAVDGVDDDVHDYLQGPCATAASGTGNQAPAVAPAHGMPCRWPATSAANTRSADPTNRTTPSG